MNRSRKSLWGLREKVWNGPSNPANGLGPSLRHYTAPMSSPWRKTVPHFASHPLRRSHLNANTKPTETVQHKPLGLGFHSMPALDHITSETPPAFSRSLRHLCLRWQAYQCIHSLSVNLTMANGVDTQQDIPRTGHLLILLHLVPPIWLKSVWAFVYVQLRLLWART